MTVGSGEYTSFGGLVSSLNAVWMVLALAALPAMVVSVVAAAQRWSPAPGHGRLFLAPALAWMVAILAIVWQWDAFVWFID